MTMQTPTPEWPDDEVPIVDDEAELPEHLDRPLEVPEADKLEQELVVPIDDDDER